MTDGSDATLKAVDHHCSVLATALFELSQAAVGIRSIDLLTISQWFRAGAAVRSLEFSEMGDAVSYCDDGSTEESENLQQQVALLITRLLLVSQATRPISLILEGCENEPCLGAVGAPLRECLLAAMSRLLQLYNDNRSVDNKFRIRECVGFIHSRDFSNDLWVPDESGTSLEMISLCISVLLMCTQAVVATMEGADEIIPANSPELQDGEAPASEYMLWIQLNQDFGGENIDK